MPWHCPPRIPPENEEQGGFLPGGYTVVKNTYKAGAQAGQVSSPAATATPAILFF